MVFRSCLLLLTFLFVLPTFGGENPGRHLTGNVTVDFFAGENLPAASPLAIDPRTLPTPAGGEKSPWIAGFLSLAVPGAGEVYTDNYVKGAAFFAAEAAFWTVAYIYNKKGNDQTSLFQDYANAHWSAVRYTEFTLNHLSALNSAITRTRDDYAADIYGNRFSLTDPPPFSSIDWEKLNAMERDISAGVGNGYTHNLPYYDQQQYYELIGKYEQFSRGWDDSDPADPPDKVNPIRSTSQRFFEYSQMRAKANDYYDVAHTFVSVAIINHVVSAIDAYWSATRFNHALHADVRMEIGRDAFGFYPVTVAEVRYDF